MGNDTIVSFCDPAFRDELSDLVRNSYQPAREVLTGIGPVAVRLPKTRDRAGESHCFR